MVILIGGGRSGLVGSSFEERLEKLKQEMECPYNFACCESNFKNLCQGESIAESYIKCDDKNCFPAKCDFSISFGYSYFCKCPIRVMVCKELK